MIDASVLLLALEPAGDAARRALVAVAEEHVLTAPMLLAYELGHVIHRKHPERYGSTPEERDEAVDAALSAIRLVVPDAASLRTSARLVDAHALTFYDAAYLALAQTGAESILLTEDRGLERVAKRVLGDSRVLASIDAAKLLGGQ